MARTPSPPAVAKRILARKPHSWGTVGERTHCSSTVRSEAVTTHSVGMNPILYETSWDGRMFQLFKRHYTSCGNGGDRREEESKYQGPRHGNLMRATSIGRQPMIGGLSVRLR